MQDNYTLRKMSNCIRILAADAVEKAQSGHPGMPLGMSDVLTLLAKNYLRFIPKDPKWLGRDRLVLSAGHGCMLLYAFYYLSGYKYFDLDSIKNFRQFNSNTPGHPEYMYYPNESSENANPIEVTTGPLGQGLATSIGMAISAKKYQAIIGDIANYKIYTIVGDGCLMEGISYEAASLAGHLNLNNLVILFDSNKVTIDGDTALSNSEDHFKKFSALGFEVASINAHNFSEINAVLAQAQQATKPYFIACNSTIAYGCNTKSGSELSHGAPLGPEEIKFLKHNLEWCDQEFFIPNDLLEKWRSIWQRNQDSYEQWHVEFNKLSNDKKQYFQSKSLYNNDNILELKSKALSISTQSTRVSSGIVIESLLQQESKMIFGSADLSGSNGLNLKLFKKISKEDFTGNFIHYGIREHAMAAIMNGLALERFIPVGGTFLVFSDYMRPAIRLAALMQLGVIYLMTHDSIAVGEDGATHQPVEQLSSLRSMPNLEVLRPADFIETVECWDIALNHAKKCITSPVILSLTRQNVPQLRQDCDSNINLCMQSHYIIASDLPKIDVILFATGSEVALAIQVKEELNIYGKKVRIFSVPSMNKLNNHIITEIIDITHESALKVAIEAGSSYSWHRIIGFDGLYINMNEFGRSAPKDQLFYYYGFDAKKITEKIMAKISSRT